MEADADRATREKVVLALIPTSSLHQLRNPQEIVDIATKLCQYIGNATGGTPSEIRGPQKQKR